jgi:biotin operon repressor
MKTIRQIADEIGVSKTAVNKQIANLGLRSGLRKNGNQFAIDEHQEALIKQAFSEKSQTEIENQTQTKTQTKTQTENHEVSDLVCVLQATIDTLQGQLEVKDRQIEKLTEALVAAQQTAAAAQALHAGTIQQQLLTGEAGADQQGQEPEQKRGWFSKLFGK